VVPRAGGAFSAYGLVNADLRRDVTQAIERALAAVDPAALEALLTQMEADAAAGLGAQPGVAIELAFERVLRVRYAWQDNALEIATGPGPLDAGALARVAAAFHAEHDREFGHSNVDDPLEVVAAGVAAVGRLPRAAAPGAEAPEPDAVAAVPGGHRQAYFRETGWVDTAVYARDDLAPGHHADGPAIVEEREATTVVPPGARLRVDRHANLLLTHEETRA
jgi:N-methylhydantoinase A